MTKFKTVEEFEDFCNNSFTCVCGQLMTGLHMTYCNKLKIMRIKLEERTLKKVLRGVTQ